MRLALSDLPLCQNGLTPVLLQHLIYFTNRPQQRQIVRILLMVPIYAIASFLSYLFRHQAVYFHVVRGPIISSTCLFSLSLKPAQFSSTLQTAMRYTSTSAASD